MKSNLLSFFTQLFQTQKRFGVTSFQDLGMTSYCLLPLILPVITPEGIANGGVITAIATTGLEWLLVSFVVLLIIAIYLYKFNSMSEIALKIDLWMTTTQNFSDFISSSQPKQKSESIFEKLSIKLKNIYKNITSSQTSYEIRQGFWSKYDLEFQEDFNKVRTVWLQGINPQTRQIKDLKFLNRGYQEFKAFLETHWTDLTDDDQQQFKNYAQSISEITEFAKRRLNERKASDLFELALVLRKLISYKRILMLIINFITLRNSSQEPESSQDSIFNFIDTQAIFANTILNLYNNSLISVEAYWDEQEPKIIETARRMIEREKLTFEEKRGLKKFYLEKNKQKEYEFLSRQKYLFYRNLPKLIRNYAGLYIWYENEEVKDYDPDRVELSSRVIRSNEVQTRNLRAIYTHQVPKIDK